jgi:hypothetical protein
MSSVMKLKEKLLFEFLGFGVAVKGLELLLHIWDNLGLDISCCEVRFVTFVIPFKQVLG